MRLMILDNTYIANLIVNLKISTGWDKEKSTTYLSLYYRNCSKNIELGS